MSTSEHNLVTANYNNLQWMLKINCCWTHSYWDADLWGASAESFTPMYKSIFSIQSVRAPATHQHSQPIVYKLHNKCCAEVYMQLHSLKTYLNSFKTHTVVLTYIECRKQQTCRCCSTLHVHMYIPITCKKLWSLNTPSCHSLWQEAQLCSQGSRRRWRREQVCTSVMWRACVSYRI